MDKFPASWWADFRYQSGRPSFRFEFSFPLGDAWAGATRRDFAMTPSVAECFHICAECFHICDLSITRAGRLGGISSVTESAGGRRRPVASPPVPPFPPAHRDRRGRHFRERRRVVERRRSRRVSRAVASSGARRAIVAARVPSPQRREPRERAVPPGQRQERSRARC